MNATIQWFIIAAALATILASIAIWAPRARLVKVIALVCATTVLPIAYTALQDILSRPRPIEMATAQTYVEDASVLSAMVVEKEAIYIWLKLADTEEPRSFQLPWDKQMAVELHKAQQQAEAQGTEVKVKKPSEANQDDQQPVFYAAPQPAVAAKQVPTEQPQVVKAASIAD